MKKIPLNTGKFALVDDDFVHNHPCTGWQENTYAQRIMYKHGKGKVALMHRLVMSAPCDLEVDHIDGNKLNNQRSNLRLCTHAENQRNRTRLNKNNTSGHKGIYWNAMRKNWYAQVTLNGRAITVGSGFKSILDAVIIRNSAASKMHGEFYHP